eukprot:s1048_g20.t1
MRLASDGRLRIVDFGLALKLGWPVGNPRGTWPFTAPEAAWPCGRPWDLAKADVFSLGAILIEMLCGTDKLFRMFGWMAQTPLNLLRVQEMVNFLATPGAVMSSMATDLGLAASEPAPMITGLMNVVPMKRWSAKEEQQQKAREGFKKLSAATEDAEQAKRWAENAVLDLQAQSHFLEADVSRLKQAMTSGKTDLDAEVARIKEEAQNHASSRDVITKSRDVLKMHCKLSDDKSSGNCAEADSALNLANLGLEKLDKFLATYIVDFTKLSEEQKADAEKTLKLQQESLFQANADLNRRKDELAELSSDVVTAKENMRLAGKADDALSTSCGPKASSMEDTIARRKEEIEQLKNAVKVLDGEAFV